MYDFDDFLDLFLFYDIFPTLLVIMFIALIVLTALAITIVCLLTAILNRLPKQAEKKEDDDDWDLDIFTEF